jgi:Asp/Glu/hydantoin racemase
MKILVINPNTSLAATESIRKEAEVAASEGTSIVAETAPRGPVNISTAADCEAQGPVVVEVIQSWLGRVNGSVIAAYSDPGLHLARSRLDLPVVGIGEGSIKEAARLGERIVILSTNRANEPLYRECARHANLADRITIRYLPEWDKSVPEALVSKDWFAAQAIEVSRRALLEDGVEVIVVAGGPLAGVARIVAGSFDVPVLDCVAAAVSRVERWIATGSPD